MSGRQRLILASASPRRLLLLGQVGIEPDVVIATDIDESPQRTELPRNLAARLARDKAKAARAAMTGEDGEGFVLAADTVVAVGRRVLPKAESLDDASECLALLSGRGHRVYTGVALLTPGGKLRQRLVETRLKFKRLSEDERQHYIASGEWRGVAGGYAIQGLAAAFVQQMVGSYSNVVGLPLAETVALLDGEGYPVRRNWIVHKLAGNEGQGPADG